MHHLTSNPAAPSAPAIRRRRRSTRALATAAVFAITGCGLVFSGGAAQAYNPCDVPLPPASCNPTPPPPPFYYVDAKPLASIVPMPVTHGSSERVTTTVHVRKQYSTSTKLETAEWVVADYHVVNDLFFVGWHVTVNEKVYTTSGYLMDTNIATIGVTPAGFGESTADAEVLTAVPIGWGDRMYDVQPVDRFSN